MIYDMYIIQHLYNPTSEQHRNNIRYSIRYSMYIRYSFNSTLSIVQSILSLHLNLFRCMLLNFFKDLNEIKYVQVRRCPEPLGFRGGFSCSLPGAFAINTQTVQS